MPRPLSEKLRSGQWWGEQALHWLLGDVVGTLAGGISSVWLPGLWAGLIAILAASLTAAIRELVQNLGDEDNDVADAVIDAVAVALGGCRASVIFFVRG